MTTLERTLTQTELKNNELQTHNQSELKPGKTALDPVRKMKITLYKQLEDNVTPVILLLVEIKGDMSRAILASKPMLNDIALSSEIRRSIAEFTMGMDTFVSACLRFSNNVFPKVTRLRRSLRHYDQEVEQFTTRSVELHSKHEVELKLADLVRQCGELLVVATTTFRLIQGLPGLRDFSHLDMSRNSVSLLGLALLGVAGEVNTGSPGGGMSALLGYAMGRRAEDPAVLNLEKYKRLLEKVSTALSRCATPLIPLDVATVFSHKELSKEETSDLEQLLDRLCAALNSLTPETA